MNMVFVCVSFLRSHLGPLHTGSIRHIIMSREAEICHLFISKEGAVSYHAQSKQADLNGALAGGGRYKY
jgi:hypothetical protein